MAYRLTFSSRAVREMGAAQAWYESQSTGLGEEFVVAIELQLIRLQQEPLLYAEVIPKVRRVSSNGGQVYLRSTGSTLKP